MVVCHGKGAPDLVARCVEQVRLLVKDVACADGDVVRLDLDVHFEVFQPAAGLQVAEGLAYSASSWGCYRTCTDVDVAKVVARPGPLLDTVVDLELAVRWHPGGLEGVDVHASHRAGGGRVNAHVVFIAFLGGEMGSGRFARRCVGRWSGCAHYHC